MGMILVLYIFLTVQTSVMRAWKGNAGEDRRLCLAENSRPFYNETYRKGEMKRMTEVVTALIWDNDKFMACQRPAHKARGLLWEFVGGKVEPGETKQQALIRECREELAVTLEVGDEFMDVTHEYPDLTVHLTLFHAAIREGVPQKLEHNDIRWITVDEIDRYEFCPADEVILERLKQVYLHK